MATETLVLKLQTGGAERKLQGLSKSMNSTDLAAKKLQGDMPRASNAIRGTGKAAATATGNIQRMGVAFRTTLGPIVLLYGAINTLNKSLQVASERQVLVAQLTNGLKKMGGTAADLEALANAADTLGKSTLFDQEDFTRAFQLLTSFQRIGVDSYGRVAKAAADVATITGQDLRGAMIQLSKALEDPARRVTDLARSGTVFTEQQKEQIKTLQESGRMLEAQDLILSEIEKQYGGAAEAAGEAGLAGAMDSLGEELRDLQEALAGSEALMRPLIGLIDKFTSSLNEANKVAQETEHFLDGLSRLFGGVGLGSEHASIGIESFHNAIINAIPGLTVMLQTLGQMRNAMNWIGDKFAGQRNFGKDYASQEKALFEAAGGWSPYDQKTKTGPVVSSPTGGGSGAGNADRARTAELEKQAKLTKSMTTSLEREFKLKTALTDYDKEILKIQFDYLDTAEKIREITDETTRAKLEGLNIAIKEKDIADVIAKRKSEEADELARKEKNRTDAIEDAKGPITKQMDQLKAELTDTEGMIVSLAQTVEAEIGSAMSSAITGLITGTKTAEEAFSEMFANIGKAFIDMATQMIAKAMVMKVLGILSPGASGGGSMPWQAAPPGFTPFAEGGYVTGPTNAVIGEGGQPEYVIPESKMAAAMASYSAGARGEQVLGGNDSAGGGEGGSVVYSPSFETVSIGGESYVTTAQMNQAMEQGMAAAAKRGAAMSKTQIYSEFRNNRSTRQRLAL